MFNHCERNPETKRGIIQKEIEAKKIQRYDAEKPHDYLVQWIINDSLAFRAGETPFFQQFLESITLIIKL
jgi:hypothetical protein